MFQRIFFFRASLRTAKVRHQDHGSSVIQYFGDGWDGRINAIGVRNLILAVEGNIKINPDQGFFVLKCKIVNRLHKMVHFEYESKFKIFNDDNAYIFNFTPTMLSKQTGNMQDLRVTIIQTNLFWEEVQKNLDHFDKLLGRINEPTDLILLPETFNTAFSINPAACAESMEGRSMDFLRIKAGEKNAVIMATLFIREGKECYNRLICMYPDGHFETYDKRHLFRLSEEYKIFKGGHQKLIVDVKGWKISPVICYDLRFPVWCRNTWRDGKYAYDLMVCLANWPAVRAYAWKQLLVARAIENQVCVAAANRIGYDGHGTWHSGDSMAIDAKGKVVYDAGEGLEAIETVTFSAADLALFRDSFTMGMDWDHFTINTKQ
jgi:predicted amidohydrolase